MSVDCIDKHRPNSEERRRAYNADITFGTNNEFGFEADDIPLMIEAIPLSGENIILQITKVEYPEELDTRFSKFSASDDKEESYYEYDWLNE